LGSKLWCLTLEQAEIELADVFNEVDEELRQEQYKKLWKKYGKYVAAVAVVVVLGTAGSVGWKEYKIAARESESARFVAAVRLIESGDPAQGSAALAALAEDAGSGYRTLARLRQAAALREAGDHGVAVSVYDRLVTDGDADKNLRDLARLLAAQAMLDLGTAKEGVVKRLEPLLTDDNPWRYSARELLGALALQEGDIDTATREFTALSDDLTAPPGIRARAAELLAAVRYGN